MKVILKREYYIFRHNLIFFLCIWTLLPIAIYILISTSIGESVVLPESFSDMNYNNWSAAGNWVVSTCIITYLLSGISIKKYKEKSSFSNSMLATPATNIEHVLGLTIWILIIAFIAVVYGELTVKRLRFSRNEIWLDADNKKFDSIQVTEEMNFHVWGIATNVIHKI